MRKLWIVWGESESSLRHALHKEDDDYVPAYKMDSTTEAMAVTTPKGHVVLRFKEEPMDPGIISHECFHAAFGILDRIGVRLSDDSEEALAYLLDWIVTQVYEAKKEASLGGSPPAECAD